MTPHVPLLRRSGKNSTEKNGAGQSVDYQRVILTTVTLVVLSAALSLHLLPSRVDLEVGQVSPETIIAQRTVRYVDSKETELRRSQAAASAGRVYDPVIGATREAVDTLHTIVNSINAARKEGKGLPIETRIARIRERIGPLLAGQVSDRSLADMLTLDEAALRRVQDDALQIVSSAMSEVIREDPADLRKARKEVDAEAADLARDAVAARVTSELARSAIRPNQIYNEQRTFALQEKARTEVQAFRGLLMQGDVIIAKGEQVLPQHLEKLAALGLMHPKLDVRSVACTVLLVIVVVTLVTVYLWRYHPDVYASTKTMWLLALLVLVSTVALRLGGSLLGITLSPAQVGYVGIFWVVAAGMFIAVLVNQQVAILIAAMLSIVLSMILNNELRYASSAFLTALVAVYCVADIRTRHDLMRAGGALAAVGIVLVWITGGIAGDDIQEMLAGSFWAGIIVPAPALLLFFLGTVPLERPFERTTHLSLLELADTNRPLLKQLSLEAPGTFSHSRIVAHLAESAAAAIGADTLAARVASYYHDIGKLRRPHFFIENQHVENVHDNMNPTLSTLVITSHIKDGIEIAKQHRLPKMVQDIIAQHHGTSLVQYFFNQYAGEQDPSTALEQQFRYGGPKPQTKEAAIVMLADCAEAASRCLDKPTPAKIELMVNQVVADRLRDGQLDESELTFREVSKITASFARSLMGTMHARIEYPDAEGRKTTSNADSDSELPRSNGHEPAPEERGPAAASG